MTADLLDLGQISLEKQTVPQLVQLIREGVRRGQLEAGRRLSEAEIARDFDISRQPVREALLVLSNEGLLEIRPQRGTFVRKISMQMVRQARFVREAIEADVVRLAAQTLDHNQVARLRQLLDAQAKCSDTEIERFITLDDEFHEFLASGVGQKHAWAIVEGLKLQLDRVRYLSLRHFPADTLLEQHTSIVDAIAKGDVAGAERCMREHLNMVVTDLEFIANNNPEKFQD